MLTHTDIGVRTSLAFDDKEGDFVVSKYMYTIFEQYLAY